MSEIRSGLLLFMAAILLAGQTVAATENEFQQWSTASIRYKLNDLYSANWLVQGRFALSDDRANLYVLRPSLHRFLGNNLTAGLGVDYIAYAPGDDEKRLWLDLAHKFKPAGLVVNQRLRLEQRFIHDIKPILRSRYRAKLNVPVTRSRWSFVLSNEVFVNLDSRGRGPVGGFEQNRLFSGIEYRVNPASVVELGYLWRYLERRDNKNVHDHAIGLNLYISR